MSGSKPDWQHVQSSNIEAIAFDVDTQTLCVRFHNGSVYTYLGTNEDIFVAMKAADSVGRYLNNVIKATYPYTRHEDEDHLVRYLNGQG